MSNIDHANDEATCDAREFAPEYHEKTAVLGFEDVSASTLRYRAVDFTYETRTNTLRTIRCVGGAAAAEHNDVPVGFVGFWHDNTKYAYSPGERELITVNRDGENRLVADERSIRRIEEVTYPDTAPVVGAVDTEVTATIYYRTKRSDSMQQVDVVVDSLESGAGKISGDTTDGERRIKALTRWERDITSYSGGREQTLGKVARVEFPKGHRFTLDVEGLTDDKADRVREAIERAVGGTFRGDEEVAVRHDGRIPEEESA